MSGTPAMATTVFPSGAVEGPARLQDYDFLEHETGILLAFTGGDAAPFILFSPSAVL